MANETSPLLTQFDKLSSAISSKDEEAIKRQTLMLNAELQKASPEEIEALSKRESVRGFAEFVEGVVEALHLGKKVYDFVESWRRR